MRHQALLACLAGAMWLVSFGFAGPFEQPPVEVKVEYPKAAPQVELKAAASKKAESKKESKTPVADLLNAAGDRLWGFIRSVEPVAGRQAVAVQAPRKVLAGGVMVKGGAMAGGIAQQIEQQYAGRFRQLYRSELHFMRLVCQPTREQYEKIAGAGDAELKAAIKKFAQAFADQQQGRARVQAQQNDPRKAIVSGIASRVKTNLSAEQAARYEKEIEERTAARRGVAISNLLAGMDRKLILTAEQRDQLNVILNKNWNDSWNQLQLIMQGGEYFPSMPDDKILPILTETQKKVWREVPKGNVHFGGLEFDMVQGVDVGEEVWTEREKTK